MNVDILSMTVYVIFAGTANIVATTSTDLTMDMSGASAAEGNACKISMLWNWYTIDSCFLARSWHNTTPGMFAGSCIGVVLFTMTLELLRRTAKEYDRYLVRKHASAATAASMVPPKDSNNETTMASPTSTRQGALQASGFRPTAWEQAIRALLHMVQFAVAYFVMLLAMYFNGYIIISIFVGAYIGAFIFHWEPLGEGYVVTSASKEPTVCCA
ncbi:Ctr copper transporter family-domain-containing protein [Daldinia loculata]|uniref:Ctr copper transporter family-domain-containing protein n=1 Tax=Daldinia loculata TaxID=103429 RepID=UPI0020C58993|nr:Ctr copper transporter family-domain-containing protein [Daldinia loculata]KAI1643533.1 Ctr copper transporter family-domain-containing protein [Daldinia loculata]